VIGAFVLFLGTFLYLFEWGDAVWEGFGCTEDTVMPTTRFSCNLTTGDLTYSVEDYWQEKSTQMLSALFTYSVLLAMPWRLAVLFNTFCSARKIPDVGVDFYGRLSDFSFNHIGLNSRRAIAIFLNLNTVFQLAHQVCHLVWNDVFSYMSQPQGLILLITGPGGGVIWGGAAGGTQFSNESYLHQMAPNRFPPTPIDALSQICGELQKGASLSSLFSLMNEEKQEEAAHAAKLMKEAEQEDGNKPTEATPLRSS